MTEHRCIVCPQLRDGEPRIFDQAQVCEPCRKTLRTYLAELVADLPLLAEHLYRSTVGAERVSGSAERLLPIAEDVWDLLLPADITYGHGDYPQDQCGYISVDTFAELWCRDWAEQRGQGELGSGLAWLTVRLDWACDEHPAVDDFAWELRRIHHGVHRYAGTAEPKPELCWAIPCRRCDLVNTLYRAVDGSGDVECRNPDCRCVYRDEDYRKWVALNAAMARRAMKETVA